MNRHSGITIIVLVVAALGLAPPAAPKPDLATSAWPMFQANVRHTGQSIYAGIYLPPLVTWTTQLPGYCGESGAGMSEAIDGTIYVSACGNLSAVNPDDGTIRWTFQGGNHSRSTPAVREDGLIFWGYADTFAAITPEGKLEWQRANLIGNYVFGGSPAVGEDGRIYFTHSGLFALSSSGSPQWVYPLHLFTHSSPAIGSDGTVYVGSWDGTLYAFTPDGNIKWQHWVSAYGNSPTVGADGTVYIGTNTATVFAFDPDGVFQWKFVSDEAQFQDASLAAPPVIGSDGTIYFGTHVTGGASDYAGIYAIDHEGALKWRVPIHRRDSYNPGVVAPLVVDKNGNLFACADNSACYGIAPDGSVQWEYVIAPGHWLRTAPYILSDGQMLILDSLGKLYHLIESTYWRHLPLVAN